MRRSLRAGIVAVAVLTCAGAYWRINQPSPSTALSDAPAPAVEAARPAPVQEPVLPQTATHEARPEEGRVQETAEAPAISPPVTEEPAQVPSPRQDARREKTPVAAPVETAPVAIETKPANVEPAPAPFETASIPTAPIALEPAAPAVEQPDLSYLHYYAYSEIPPATKPADTVLASLKALPPGTPIEEIKRVSDLLKLDFGFMKTVAKIESGFDPKQRTGSYIGLFQLSNKEFAMYGSGDILDPRDNTVAAALKFMTENVMFEMFTHRTPSFNDIYLIHQQGVEGAVEHLSQPRRLAWRSMCATYEGKEKGEKWCKRAIWGNTLPALKRAWKNVNKVTSADFVGMWRQRVAEFYAQYSQSAAK